MTKDPSASRHTAVRVALVITLVGVAALVVASGGAPDVLSLSGLPLVLVGAIAYAILNRDDRTYRWAVRVALGAAAILCWMIGAVGVLGPDDHHPADVLYFFVLATGIIGAVVTRFEARGMARAMTATAIAQMLVPAIALAARLHPNPASDLVGIFGAFALNGMYAAVWLASAFLFRKSARS